MEEPSAHRNVVCRCVIMLGMAFKINGFSLELLLVVKWLDESVFPSIVQFLPPGQASLHFAQMFGYLFDLAGGDLQLQFDFSC